MRLQLRLTLAACAAAASLGVAGDGAAQSVARTDARAGVYQDTDRTTVTTTNLTARGETGRVALETRYLVDVISSASVDVVSAATGRIHDLRNEAEWGAAYRDDVRRVSAAYIRSVEHDWWSHAGRLGFTQDLAHHDVTLAIAATYVSNDVGRAYDPGFARHMNVAGAVAGVTGVLSPRDVAAAHYEVSYVDGYQASPYRFVYFGTSSGGPLPAAAPETDPDTRLRHAVTVRYNHALAHHLAQRWHGRAYADSWGVVSGLLGMEYVLGIGDVDFGAFVRGYAQRRADFYHADYAQPMRYMTADRELSTFADAFAGTSIVWRKERPARWLENLRLAASMSAFYFRFLDFPRLPGRAGVLGEIGIGGDL